jgi:hypothetical protein
MLRSHSQILYSYLPGAVFRHEERVYGKVVSVDGDRLTGLNEAVIYEEIASYLERWPDEQRHDLPLPKDLRVNEYRIIRPDLVRWELFPLVFECSRRSCARVCSFRTFDDLAKSPTCQRCGGPLQQLRFYNAHNCGQIRAIHVPRCSSHGYDELSFDNTGSFLTATWRCHGPGCNGGVVHRTNMSPCNCHSFPGRDNVVRMRAHTLDDPRAYQAHSIDLVNIDSSVFQTYQRHPARAQIAVAHFLGLVDGIKDGMRDVDTGSDGERMSAEQWAVKEATYREMGLNDDEIAALKKMKGPADSGVAAITDISSAVLETVAKNRPFYERAAVYDTAEVPRVSLVDQLQRARERGDTLQAEAIEAACMLATAMGISELAVTWEFPIAKVAFGYTREKHTPGEAAIRGFRHARQHEGKYPVFAVGSSTEALLVTLSAKDVLAFLHHKDEIATAPADEDAARRQLLEIFAAEQIQPTPAQTIRLLIHTLSHLLLRGLDDGQIGFAEASLAEWLVPETLTFAVYANTLKDFTLGSLWTLLNNRSLSWLRAVVNRSVRCENDPICYEHSPRSCERCSYLTFGCRTFNESLDRETLYDYLLWRGVLGSRVSPECADT